MQKGRGLVNVFLFYFFTVTLFLLGTIIGNRSITTISEYIPVERKHHIVIDAGHGGEDGGAISCTGKYESHFNLQISLRLNDLLHFLGYDTVMTRQTDTSVSAVGDTVVQRKTSDLRKRVDIVNNTPDGLLISIHQNYYPESIYKGAQIFYAASAASEHLAKDLQDAIRSSVNPWSNREAKQGTGIFLLEKAKTTGILVECGFLSNVEEEAILGTPEYQKQLCSIIAATCATFLADT